MFTTSTLAAKVIEAADALKAEGIGIRLIGITRLKPLADEIAAEATEMTAFEDFVTEKVMEGRTIIGLYPPTHPQTLTDFAAWRQAHGR